MFSSASFICLLVSEITQKNNSANFQCLGGRGLNPLWTQLGNYSAPDTLSWTKGRDGRGYRRTGKGRKKEGGKEKMRKGWVWPQTHLTHLIIDGTTLTEILLKGNESAHSRMPQYLDNLFTWSTDNCMVINSKKTKEMILGTANKSPPLLTISNSPVERVTCFKLLGVNICNDLRWDAHVR